MRAPQGDSVLHCVCMYHGVQGFGEYILPALLQVHHLSLINLDYEGIKVTDNLFVCQQFFIFKNSILFFLRQVICSDRGQPGSFPSWGRKKRYAELPENETAAMFADDNFQDIPLGNGTEEAEVVHDLLKVYLSRSDMPPEAAAGISIFKYIGSSTKFQLSYSIYMLFHLKFRIFK